MIDGLIQFCSSRTGLGLLLIGTDSVIACAYFAIPLTMAIVLSRRKEDIPYPWLWGLFVVFIVACGLTHLVHVWSATSGIEYLPAQVTVNFLCAIASVGTAIAFAFVLRQIKDLPSPKRQRQELERLVAQRTEEKDRLIQEINHRIGNQLQILSSLLSIEARRTTSGETLGILARLKDTLDKMGEQHAALRATDYLTQIDAINDSAIRITG
ncbi:MAG: histidine kinase dimerization/phosphoacceptor domain -containing protein [Xanthobacteraceae bacterium]